MGLKEVIKVRKEKVKRREKGSRDGEKIPKKSDPTLFIVLLVVAGALFAIGLGSVIVSLLGIIAKLIDTTVSIIGSSFGIVLILIAIGLILLSSKRR